MYKHIKSLLITDNSKVNTRNKAAEKLVETIASDTWQKARILATKQFQFKLLFPREKQNKIYGKQ